MHVLTFMREALALLSKAISKNLHITIYGDYDVDGLSCILTLKRLFILIGYTNYSIVPYSKRTHKIDNNVASVLVENQSGLCIICDTGSSELETVNYLKSICPVIVLDHHRGSIMHEDINERLIVVNPALWGDDVKMSAACVVYELIMEWVRENRPEEERYFVKMLSFYPFLSIYADGAYGNNDYCFNLYQDAQQAILPPEFNFASQHYVPTKRFVLFSVAPPINSAFRNNRLDLINSLFLFGDQLMSYEKMNLMEEMMTLRSGIREHIDKLCSLIEPIMIGGIGLVDLTGFLNQGISSDVIWNNKGLIANKMADKYKCVCLTIVKVDTHYTVSCRDYYGRNILSYMQTFYEVNGHDAAFGGTLDLAEVIDLKQTLGYLSKKIGDPKPRRVMPMHNLKETDLDNIALANEFCHQNDVILISVPKYKAKLEHTPPSFKDKFWQYHLPYGDGKTIYVKKENFDDAEKPYLTLQLYKGKRLMASMIEEA